MHDCFDEGKYIAGREEGDFSIIGTYGFDRQRHVEGYYEAPNKHKERILSSGRER